MKTVAKFAVLAGFIADVNSQANFRVATYNVYNYDDGADWDNRQDWVRDNIQAANPDFIALQELRMDNLCQSLPFWPFCNRNSFWNLNDLLEPLGYTGHFVGAQTHGGQLEGLAFYTKYDFSEDDVTTTSISSGNSEDGNNRIVVNVPINIPGYGTVNFFNTHWTFDSGETSSNAAGVADFIQETASSQAGQSGDFKYIVLGDLNTGTSFGGLTGRDLPHVYGGSTARLKDSYQGGGATFCNCRLNGDACSLTSRLDYILVQNTASVTVRSTGTVTHPQYPNVCPSDHKLYYADISMN